MEDKKIVTPVQPYLTLDAEDYQELLNRRMGISSFYEFNVKNGNSGNFRAVPDGSTDLVFGIGEKDVKVLIGGTVLKAKNWEFDDGRYYFGARFLPGKCILPKSLSIKEVVNADVEIDRNEYGSGLTESLAEAADVKQRAQILMQYLSSNQGNHSKDSAHVLEEYMRQRIYATDGNISIQMLRQDIRSVTSAECLRKSMGFRQKSLSGLSVFRLFWEKLPGRQSRREVRRRL